MPEGLFCTVVTAFYMLLVSFNVKMFAFLKWLQSGHIRTGNPKMPNPTQPADGFPATLLRMRHSLLDKLPWLSTTRRAWPGTFAGNDATARRFNVDPERGP